MEGRFLELSVYFFVTRIILKTFASYKTKNTMRTVFKHHFPVITLPLVMVLLLNACEILDDDIERHTGGEDSTYVGLNAVAEILTALPIELEQLNEVHSAVSSSSSNGYDEEYTMIQLFASPGAGVGDRPSKSTMSYDRPMRQLIRETVHNMADLRTRVSAGEPGLDPAVSLNPISSFDPDAFLDALMASDIQIYWPFSENWNGEDLPIITYDPEDGSHNNIGFRLVLKDDGSRCVEEVIVDEAMAASMPVWVVNRNSDAGYTSLEMLRREDPDWGNGGGTIIVKSDDEPLRTLILKDFTMNRNYDTWFAGASEFFVKIGYLDDFTASTEAELRLYNPMVTDFMIVVKRNQVGIPQPFNAILMSDWSPQMSHCAFMITEDDGGTQTDWKCAAIVKIASKSYGVDISLPIKTRDENVWRGQLANRWLEQNSNVSWAFGDVDLTFEIRSNL